MFWVSLFSSAYLQCKFYIKCFVWFCNDSSYYYYDYTMNILYKWNINEIKNVNAFKKLFHSDEKYLNFLSVRNFTIMWKRKFSTQLNFLSSFSFSFIWKYLLNKCHSQCWRNRFVFLFIFHNTPLSNWLPSKCLNKFLENSYIHIRSLLVRDE